MTPASFDRLVRTCLAKDPDQRVQSAHDVKLVLEWIRDAKAEEAQPAAAPKGWPWALPWALFGATALGLAAFAWFDLTGVKSTAEAEPVRFEIPLPKDLTRFSGTFALSADGRKLAFSAAGSDGISRIWIRDLGSHTRFWAPSPDGKRFLFLAPQQQQDTPLTVVLNSQAGMKK